MNTILLVLVMFGLGAIIGRYFEKIAEFIYYMREDLQKTQERTRKSLDYAREGVNGK